MKTRYKFLLCFIIYISFLVFMVIAEGTSENATILTIWDAIWYSFVTITTVGYGDVYPVTLPGKVVGSFFLLLGAGLFAVILSFFITQFSGYALPKLRLLLFRKKVWYIFPHMNRESAILAKSISETNKDCVFLFEYEEKVDSKTKDIIQDIGGIIVKQDLPEIIKLQNQPNLSNICILGEDDMGNFTEADFLSHEASNVFCQLSFRPDSLPDNISVFNVYDNCARYYWQNNPLGFKEKNIVVVGCKKYGSALIEQALLQNVILSETPISYHLFEQAEEYIVRYDNLNVCFDVNPSAIRRDSIFVYKDSWMNHRDILKNADRIIICTDSDVKNQEIFQTFSHYYQSNGKIYIRAKKYFEDMNYNNSYFPFGMVQEIYNSKMVLRESLNYYAKEIHQSYVDLYPEMLPWNRLSNFLKRSNYAIADHMLMKVRMLLQNEEVTVLTAELLKKAYEYYNNLTEEEKTNYRRLEHERWMRFYILNNWHYNETKDNAKRLHNQIVPFEMLDLENQRKDDNIYELMKRFT